MNASKLRPLAALVAALSLLAACSSPSAKEQAVDADRAGLVEASQTIAAQAKACHGADQAAGLTPEGLELLGAHAPQWVKALDAPPGDPAEACDPDGLAHQLDLAQILSLRLWEAGDSPAVMAAMGRALAVDVAAVHDLEVPDPEVADLQPSDAKQLEDLALAEDQAGFVDEFVAATTADADLRATVAGLASLHRGRADALALMAADAGGADPRQDAYVLPATPRDAEETGAITAQAELALASHYAALPYPGGAEGFVTWELTQARNGGAEIPALPFLR
jgi:hypothetical protein